MVVGLTAASALEVARVALLGVVMAGQWPAAGQTRPAARSNVPPAGDSFRVVQVRRIRFATHPDYTRVVVDLTGQVRCELSRPSNPARLYVDLLYATTSPTLRARQIPVGDVFLHQIRIEETASVTRVILDLNRAAAPRVFSLTDPPRLVVDLMQPSAPAMVTEASPRPAVVPPVPPPASSESTPRTQAAPSASVVTPAPPAQAQPGVAPPLTPPTSPVSTPKADALGAQAVPEPVVAPPVTPPVPLVSAQTPAAPAQAQPGVAPPLTPPTSPVSTPKAAELGAQAVPEPVVAPPFTPPVPLVSVQTPAAPAQEQAMPNLKIVILDGEGATNNVKRRTARDVIVQVEDVNQRPVAGATVAFLVPSSGPSGTFTGGSRFLTVITDQRGRAIAKAFRPNGVPGGFKINVTASFQGQRASAAISQTNAIAGAAAAGSGAGAAGAAGGTGAGAGAGISAATVGIIVGAAAAVAAGIGVAASRGADKPSTLQKPPVRIGVGSGSVVVGP